MALLTTGHSVDDFLGPREGRFFGDGYRRVAHALTDVRVAGSESEGVVEADGHLRYPVDWSQKSTGVLRPHASTIDALVMAVESCEAYVAHGWGLDAGQRRRSWLRSVDIQAGRAPQEELSSVPVRATVACTASGEAGRRRTTFDCVVGALRVRCELDHDAGRVRRTAGRYASAEALLGPAADRLYGHGYRSRTHEIDRIQIDDELRHVTADIAVAGAPAPAGGEMGVEGAYQPALSAVDCIVTLAQLAQVLAYGIDDIERGQSSTLWMRRLRLTRETPPAPLPEPLAGRVEVARSTRLPFAGAVWRSLEVTGGCGGYACRGAIAHRLPADPAGSAPSSLA